MPLFFKNKQPDPRKKTIKREVITLVCPECQHEQAEPKIAMSTYCRGCGSHYKIDHGKVVPYMKNPSNPFAPPRSESGQKNTQEDIGSESIGSEEPTNTKRTGQATPAPDKRLTNELSTGNSSEPARRREAPPKSELRKKTAPSSGFFHKKISPRSVQCLECDRKQDVPAEASSTHCPACGTYISLKDYIIRENWNQRIQTRGNVTILKKASVIGVTIRCHHLLVQGTLKGGADCSGDFVLSNHSKIIGKVRCNRLIIEKRAQVAFANEIECIDAIIDGSVTGNFICSGKLHLKKKATLNGNIKVGTMIVDKGANHNGKVSIGQ